MTHAIYIEQLRRIDKALGGGGELAGNIVERVERLTAERDALASALTALFNNSLSEDETRLLMVIAGGSTMANPKGETGRANHARCDRIKAAREQSRAALAPAVQEAQHG